jgi:hypothetical protein
MSFLCGCAILHAWFSVVVSADACTVFEFCQLSFLFVFVFPKVLLLNLLFQNNTRHRLFYCLVLTECLTRSLSCPLRGCVAECHRETCDECYKIQLQCNVCTVFCCRVLHRWSQLSSSLILALGIPFSAGKESPFIPSCIIFMLSTKQKQKTVVSACRCLF